MSVPYAAILAIARNELRRRWRALLVIGIVAGLVGAGATGAVALSRRTATAHDRLEEAVHVEDLRITVFDQSLVDAVVALPGARATWSASMYVGRVEGRGGIVYLGLLSGPQRPADLFTPVVVEGRMFDDDDPTEAVVFEQAAERIGVGVGDELELAMLTPEEVAMFDTGFGDPDGPTVQLRITGVIRTPSDASGSPLLGSPAFARQYPDAAATALFVRLDDTPDARAAYVAGVERIAADATDVPGAEEFPPLQVMDPRLSDVTVRATARVLVGGLAVFAAVVAAVGLLVLAQVLARHHAATAHEQRIEAALGLTTSERTLARVIPGALAAAVAGAVVFAGSAAAGAIDPPGAMRRVEPAPGFAPNAAIALVGAVATAGVVLALASVTARRAAFATTWIRTRPTRAVGAARALVGRASIVAGVGFALSGVRGRSAPVRSSLVGAAAGIAGLIAALTFASSLDRLADEPARYGWTGDFTVVDVTEPIVQELLDDPRLEAVTVIEASAVELDGVTLQGYAFDDRRGHNGWTIVEGHAPNADDQIVLGSRIADDLALDVGDVVVATARDGTQVELTVVGRGVGPSANGEALGESVLLTPRQLAAVERTQSFDEAIVRVAPGVDPEVVFAELAPRYEVMPREMPVEVANLTGLGRLPEILGAFLAGIAVLALVHALVVTTTRRAADIAVLRSVGATGRDVALVVAAMAVTVTLAGLVLGVPIGYGIGRLVWWAVADSVGVATDASYPLLGTFVAAPTLVAIAIVVSWLPARRAAKLRPVQVLRAE